MNATLSISSASGGDVRTPVPRAQLNGTPPPPPGLEVQAPMSSLHGILVKATPMRHRCLYLVTCVTSAPSLQARVSTTQVGTHAARSSATHKRSASTALAGTHAAIGADPRAGRGPFPKPRPVVLPMVSFGQAKPAGLGHIHNAGSDLIHRQYGLSILQWNPGPARRNPTQIIAANCGRFHAVILQEASDHVPHITDQFIAYTANTDLAILLNKDTFEPNHAVFAFNEASTSKETWSMVIPIDRGLLRRPSLSGTSTVTFCSVHIHHVVAKKRDASTDLRRFHGYMHQHNVDFVGGDFNMSAFSTIGDVFLDPEFAAPGNSLLWGLGGLGHMSRFLTMPKRPYEWRMYGPTHRSRSAAALHFLVHRRSHFAPYTH